MKTIALRFSDSFAPSDGTIAEHCKLIDEFGFVWYGKLEIRVSKPVIDSILDNEAPRILLIHSGKVQRYWAFVDCISYDEPQKDAIPLYYRNDAKSFKTWFRVTIIIAASKSVLSNCLVISSNRPLFEISKSSMSPYFIIETEENTF